MSHDPLCDWTEDPDPEDIFCHCALIARVRADERERRASECDAARAEVAALGELVEAQRIEAADDQRSRLVWVQAARRDVLADLRAKVSALDSDPGWAHGARLVSRAAVLDLIDEAQR